MIKTFLKVIISLISAFTLYACSYYNAYLLEEGEYNFKNRHYHLAFLQLMPLAEHGQPEAEYAIAYMYFYGQGVTEDLQAASDWMNRSAAQHYPPALIAQPIVSQKLAAFLAGAKPVAIKDKKYWVN